MTSLIKHVVSDIAWKSSKDYKPVKGRCSKKITGILTVETPNEDVQNAVGRSVRYSWMQALNRLRRTLARLNNQACWKTHEIPNYAELYFLVRKLTPELVREKIVPILELTQNGLKSDVTIRVAEKITEGNDEGLVINTPVGDDKKGPGIITRLEDNKKYSPSVIYLKQHAFDHAVRAPKKIVREFTYKRKTYTVEDPNMTRRIACVTLLHEATHKYAGTWDYCYFDSEGEEPRKPEHGQGDVFDDHVKSLQNADGFAWFAYNVGKPEEGV
jgi:hypothetical protein